MQQDDLLKQVMEKYLETKEYVVTHTKENKSFSLKCLGKDGTFTLSFVDSLYQVSADVSSFTPEYLLELMQWYNREFIDTEKDFLSPSMTSKLRDLFATVSGFAPNSKLTFQHAGQEYDISYEVETGRKCTTIFFPSYELYLSCEIMGYSIEYHVNGKSVNSQILRTLGSRVIDAINLGQTI